MAKHDFEQAIELEPANPETYIARGSYYLELKKKKLARTDFRKALELGASQEDVASLLKEAGH